ncbi:hypothetical protein AMTRI_Chr06g200860 [Amborella trichopoda]
MDIFKTTPLIEGLLCQHTPSCSLTSTFFFFFRFFFFILVLSDLFGIGYMNYISSFRSIKIHVLSQLINRHISSYCFYQCPCGPYTCLFRDFQLNQIGPTNWYCSKSTLHMTKPLKSSFHHIYNIGKNWEQPTN